MNIKLEQRPANNEINIYVPFNIVIERYFSESECADNMKLSKTIIESGGEAAWNLHCEEVRRQIAEKVDRFLGLIQKHFTIGQLNDSGDNYPNYDLWFWCNRNDHSYIHLNFIRQYKGASTEKTKSDAARIESLYKDVLEILKEYDEPNLIARVNFIGVPLLDEVDRIASEKAVAMNGKTIRHGEIEGKFWIDSEGQYCFKKKYAKRKYFKLYPYQILECRII